MAFTIENDTYASLTNVSLNRSYATTGENIQLTFSIKVSNSSSALAVNGNVDVTFGVGNGGNVVKQFSSVSIAKGKSKSFTVEFNMGSYVDTLDEENFNFMIMADNADGFYFLRIVNAITYIYQRVAPEILNGEITDAHDSMLGYAKDYSILTFIGNAQLDAKDPTLTATHHLKIKGGESVLFEGSNDSGTIFVGALSYSGVATCEYTVIDSAGNTSETSLVHFTLRDYLPPSFMHVSANRCTATYDDAGNIIIEDSITGRYVEFDLSYRIEEMYTEIDYGITGAPPMIARNEYSLTLRYAGSDGSAGMADITDLADGSYYPMLNFVSNGESVFPSTEFNEGIDYTFEIEIADEFTEVTHQIYISRSTGVFNIEKNGVAIGMISTATDSQKKFEVHEDYETHLYGDAYCYAGIKTFGGGEFCTQSQAALGIQSGALENVGGQAGGTCSDHDVTFLTPFAEGTVPVVVASFRTSSSASTFGRCTCSVHSKTNTGFTIRFFNGDTSSRSPGFDWIAIGQVAAVEDEPETETTATTSLLGEAVLGEMVLGEG